MTTQLSKSDSFHLRKTATIEKRSNVPSQGARFTRKAPDSKPQEEIDLTGLKSESDFCLQLLKDGFVQSYVDF